MKKNRIPFRLTEYNKGGYTIETKGSEIDKPRKVRIICTDKKGGNSTLVALIDFGDTEGVYTYTTAGHWTCDTGSALDLMLVKYGFENGDILVSTYYDQHLIFPYREETHNGAVVSEVSYLIEDNNINYSGESIPVSDSIKNCRLANKKERKMLFGALYKDNKRWNYETKKVEDIKSTCSFKPFDKVLARNSDCSIWSIDFFSNYDSSAKNSYNFVCLENNYKQCIPYNEETKCLLGKTENYEKN